MNSLLHALHTIFLAGSSATITGIAVHSSRSISHGSLPYDAILSFLLQGLIFIANLAGGLVVGVSTVRGLILYIAELARNHGDDIPKRDSPIARTFPGPRAGISGGRGCSGDGSQSTQQDIEILAAIVVLRTVLNFFLQRELAEAERRQGVHTESTGGAAGVGRNSSR
jgi:hypothetical protein